MIRTITLNTGFDELYTVSGFSFGGVGDVLEHTTLASGKGFNVARVVGLLGERVKAYGLVGSLDRDEFASRLGGEELPAGLVAVPGRTRRNLTLLDVDGRRPAAHFKGPGFKLENDAPFRALLELLGGEIEAGDLVTLNGSTPKGLSAVVWAECGRLAIEKGARLIVDVSGEPLRRVLEQCRALACKPNEEEMGVLTGNLPEQEQAARLALEFMSSHEVTLPTVTLGQDGLRFVADGEFWSARCDVTNARVVVGAGDACVAGLAVAFVRGVAPLSDIARHGVAAATVHVRGETHSNFAAEIEKTLPSVRLDRLH